MNERKKPAAVAVPYSPNELLYRRLWHALNVLLTLSSLFLLYTAMWDLSTRSFLRGFSDAIVTVNAALKRKVAAILSWMEHGPVCYAQAVG